MLYTPDFIQIPHQLFGDRKITPGDCLLYGVIYWLSKLKDGKCIASNETLAETCFFTPGSIQNSLARLEERGYIKRIFKDEEKKVRLEIVPLVTYRKVSSDNDTVSSTNDTHVSSTNDQNKKTINKKSNTTILSEKSDDRFEEFWSIYPKKEKKKTTKDIWSRRKLGLKATEIIEFVKKARETDRWQRGFVKQPTTFLNGECWNDDLSSYGAAKSGNTPNVYHNGREDNMLEKLQAKIIRDEI